MLARYGCAKYHSVTQFVFGSLTAFELASLVVIGIRLARLESEAFSKAETMV